MFAKNQTLANVDPELFATIQKENVRQQEHIELIASENYCSPAVMEAQGSQLTNKYAEGYPGKRYYGGCEHVDVVEQLAIDRLKQRTTQFRLPSQPGRILCLVESWRYHHGYEPC